MRIYVHVCVCVYALLATHEQIDMSILNVTVTSNNNTWRRGKSGGDRDKATSTDADEWICTLLTTTTTTIVPLLPSYFNPCPDIL